MRVLIIVLYFIGGTYAGTANTTDFIPCISHVQLCRSSSLVLNQYWSGHIGRLSE